MNSTRCFETITAVVLVLAVCAGTAAALSVSTSGVPDQSQVGEEVTVTVTIEDPYQDAPSEWTLQGETDLQNVSWTVEESFQGDSLGERTFGRQSFDQGLPLEADQGDVVTVELTGTVPPVEEFAYDPRQNFTLLAVEQVTGNNAETLVAERVPHYTAESLDARQAIEEAAQAIEAAGGNSDAESRLDDARALYEAERFDEAASTAGEARDIAQNAQQSQQTTQLVLFAVAGLVVLGAAVGGVYYWRSQQGPDNKLQ